jgi:hypothetical protein
MAYQSSVSSPLFAYKNIHLVDIMSIIPELHAAAFFRAIESARPEGERVCFDPLAIKFLDPVRRASASV